MLGELLTNVIGSVMEINIYQTIRSTIWIVSHCGYLILNSPDPTLTWSKVGGKMPIGRYKFDRYNTELIINNVQQSDEGDYTCRAVNTNGNQDHVIQIDVQGD